MVEIIKTTEGLKVDCEFWKNLRLDTLPVDKLIQLARMQRAGNIKDFTNIMGILIGNEVHTILKKGIQQLDK